MRDVLAAIGLVLALSNHCMAVVIADGTGIGNTTAPAGLPQFANVGVRGSGSAVYLGSGWVLTAAHVGAGNTLLNNTWYSAVAGSAVQLANPTGAGFTPLSDLMLFRISGTPDLPPVTISDSAPHIDQAVTMIGYGRDRKASEAFWTADWMPATSPSPYAGFIWTSTNSMRWGTNTISSVQIPQMIGTNSETAFATRFTGATAHNAQGAPGDSGGAVFVTDSAGQTELGGIMSAIQTLYGQPWGASIFGELTYAADLSVYRSEIYQAMSLPGDVNFDGVINGLDMAQVTSQWGMSGAGASVLAGDANHDGVVNGLDLSLVASYWTRPWTPAAGATAAVPEPATLTLLVLGAVLFSGFLSGRRRGGCL